MALIDHYLNLITSEHRDKPKFMATVKALLEPSDAIFETAIYIDDEFDLDEAVGAQEDVLGDIVGMGRTLPYKPIASSQVMDNETYRDMIKAKIAKNAWKGGINDLEEIWKILFDTRIPIRDNQDMTITVTLDPYSGLLRENIVNGLIIPKPQSVELNYEANYTFTQNIHVGVAMQSVIKAEISRADNKNITTSNDMYIGAAVHTTKKITLGGNE